MSRTPAPVRPVVPAVVIGVGITALGAMRCLGRRGIPLYVAGASDELVTRSRWYRPLPGKPIGEPSEPELREALTRWGADRAVILPCTDGWATLVSGLPPDLAARFPSSIATPASIRRFIDKAAFAETLRETRVPHPHTIILRSPDDLASVSGDAFPNYFLKPTRSRPFAKKYGVKGLRPTSRDHVLRLLSETAGMDLELMLQEYIPGPPTDHYFVEGFVDRHGHVAGMLARRRIRMFPREFGNSTSTASIPLSEVEPAAASVRTLLDAVRYRGIFSAEFKRDSRDGAFKVLEVNARPWWYVEFAAKCGVDVCHMAYRDALGEEVPPVDAYRTGRRCVYIRMDIRSRSAAPKGAARPSLGSLVRCWMGAEHLTLSHDDPAPGLRELFLWGRTRIRKRLRL